MGREQNSGRLTPSCRSFLPISPPSPLIDAHQVQLSLQVQTGLRGFLIPYNHIYPTGCPSPCSLIREFNKYLSSTLGPSFRNVCWQRVKHHQTSSAKEENSSHADGDLCVTGHIMSPIFRGREWDLERSNLPLTLLPCRWMLAINGYSHRCLFHYPSSPSSPTTTSGWVVPCPPQLKGASFSSDSGHLSLCPYLVFQPLRTVIWGLVPHRLLWWLHYMTFHLGVKCPAPLPTSPPPPKGRKGFSFPCHAQGMPFLVPSTPRSQDPSSEGDSSPTHSHAPPGQACELLWRTTLGSPCSENVWKAFAPGLGQR